MKPSLFFLLFFTITVTKLASLSQASPILDAFFEPVTPGEKYFLVSSIFKSGGGLKPGVSDQYSPCPVDVIQAEFSFMPDNGVPVVFAIPSSPSPSPSDSSNALTTGSAVEIGFSWKPGCVESATWAVFEDSGEKAWVGIGGLEDHVRAEKVVNGSFKMEDAPWGRLRFNAYKLLFCREGSGACSDVGIEYRDKTRRLVLGGRTTLRFNIFHTEEDDDVGSNHNHIKQVLAGSDLIHVCMYVCMYVY
ncbi:kunitz-type trypsin inhibitor-like 2 protein [Senna tora]|uniref:Kunitz-type trypsin inhibitor-like 2 protein n=1 Tax=Senna tora TaxID=362788 RepID=A0A834T132_9FABA|nr:kunitz-type trypsin inhibitor-like 2 protein [Senna tora]